MKPENVSSGFVKDPELKTAITGAHQSDEAVVFGVEKSPIIISNSVKGFSYNDNTVGFTEGSQQGLCRMWIVSGSRYISYPMQISEDGKRAIRRMASAAQSPGYPAEGGRFFVTFRTNPYMAERLEGPDTTLILTTDNILGGEMWYGDFGNRKKGSKSIERGGRPVDTDTDYIEWKTASDALGIPLTEIRSKMIRHEIPFSHRGIDRRSLEKALAKGFDGVDSAKACTRLGYDVSEMEKKGAIYRLVPDVL